MTTPEPPDIQPPHPRPPRRFLSFTLFIWAFVAAAFVVAIIWPMISGVIVAKTWDSVPCRLSATGDAYFYSYKSQKYYSNRLDLWDRFHIESHPVPNDDTSTPNTTNCYVNPANPLLSVLFPNALERISGAAPRATAWGLLAVAATLMTFKVRHQAKLRAGGGYN